MEVYIAAGVSTLGLLAATESDYGIFKILIFSRATSSLVKLVGEKTGWYTPINDKGEENRRFTVESFLAIASCVFMVYCYTFQIEAMSPSLVKMITNGAGLSDDELRFFDSLRAITEIKRRGLKFD